MSICIRSQGKSAIFLISMLSMMRRLPYKAKGRLPPPLIFSLSKGLLYFMLIGSILGSLGGGV